MAIYTSPFGDIALRDVTITQRLLEGMGGRDRVAMIDGPSGREWTAGEIADGIRRVAGGLAARGIGPGRCVAIMLPNMPEFVLAFHGAAWAGATVTTVNPTYRA